MIKLEKRKLLIAMPVFTDVNGDGQEGTAGKEGNNYNNLNGMFVELV